MRHRVYIVVYKYQIVVRVDITRAHAVFPAESLSNVNVIRREYRRKAQTFRARARGRAKTGAQNYFKRFLILSAA